MNIQIRVTSREMLDPLWYKLIAMKRGSTETETLTGKVICNVSSQVSGPLKSLGKCLCIDWIKGAHE